MLLAAQGRSTGSIAEEVGVQPRIDSNWRRRFAEHGLGQAVLEVELDRRSRLKRPDEEIDMPLFDHARPWTVCASSALRIMPKVCG